MDSNQVNSSGGQLPSIQGPAQGRQSAPSAAPSIPGQAQSAAQQAQAVLTSSMTPYQMAQEFDRVKSQYLASQGIQIGG